MQKSTRKLYDAVADAIGVPAVRPTRKQQSLLARIRAEYYHDFVGIPVLPTITLVKDLRTCKLLGLIPRAKNGEFDATPEEARAWQQSAEGMAAMRILMN